MELRRAIAALRASGDFAPAVPLAEEVLALRREEQGEAWYQTVDAAREAAWLKRIAALTEPVRAELAEAERLDQEFDEIYRTGKYAEGIARFEKQLEVRKRLLGKDDGLVALSLNQLGILHESAGDLEAAERLLREALPLYRQRYGDEHPSTAAAEENLASILSKRAEHRAAEDLLRSALAVRRKLNGAASPKTAVAAAKLADVLAQRGDLLQARRILAASLDTLQKAYGDQHPWVGKTKFVLGKVLLELGDHAAAERLFRESLEIRDDVRGASVTRHALAQLYLRTGDYARAEDLLRGVLAERRALLGREHFDVASALLGLGDALAGSGQPGEAETCYREAIEIASKSLGHDHRRTADAVRSLGNLLKSERRFDEAKTALEDALERYRRGLGPDERLADVVLVDLADLQWSQGDRAVAEGLFRQVLERDRKRLGASHPFVATATHNLAIVLFDRNEPDRLQEAEELFRTAIDLRRKHRSPLLCSSLSSYADLLLTNGRAPEAIPAYEEAIAQVESLRASGGGDEIDRARHFSDLAMEDPFGGLARALLQSAASRAEADRPAGEEAQRAAFDAVERGRGRAVLDLMGRAVPGDLHSVALARARRRGDEALEKRVASLRQREVAARGVWSAAERGIAASERDSSLSAEERRGLVVRLEKQRDDARLDEQLALRELGALTRSELSAVGLTPMSSTRLAACLEPEEVLLAYDVSASDCLLFVLSPSGAVAAHMLRWPDGSAVDRRSLSEAITEHFAESSRERSRAPSGQKTAEATRPRHLFEALVPPEVAQKLFSRKRVLVVPDGPLWRLPLETLPLRAGENVLWVDRGPPLIYAPSGTVIANRRERSRNRPRSPNADDRLLLVAAGDPDFAWEEDRSPVEPPQDADEAHRVAVLESSRMRGGFRDLPRLPGTKSEVDAIARLAAAKDEKAAVRVLSGQDSTVTNLFRAADRPRFLHLATHGLAWEARRAHETALAFAAPRVVAPDDIGFLRLSDLLSRWGGRLDGTRLVTLSACRSALGSEETGEGFVALTWGFLYAGADSVVASLWKVDDEATFLLMRRFYANVFSRELPPADALHEAKRWLRGLDRSEAAALLRGAKEVPPARTESADPRRGYAEPFFWGAFVLVGGGG